MRKNNKTKILICVVLLFCVCGTACSGRMNDTDASNASSLHGETSEELVKYGVFIGLEVEDIEVLFVYDIVVIDAEYYTEEDIALLHQNNVYVYSYLNVGSVEVFRDVYAEMTPCILGAYENWQDEFWVDVSSASWQAYIAQQAKALSNKGVDGFFVDNVDVYYYYPSRETFDGLILILNDLKQYGKDVMINGGDVFVEEAVLTPSKPLAYVTCVNQECVFTNIDFEKDILIKQDEETSLYYRDYIERCKEAGLAVYITEDADVANVAVRQDVQTYCAENEFIYYIASSKWLT